MRQEAYAAALQSWTVDGIPNNPAAWITTAARRRGIDAIRRDQTFRSKLPLLVEPDDAAPDMVEEIALDDALRAGEQSEDSGEVVPDERLRLIFLCCHPALSQQAQMALTLRLVCGVEASDIARAFLISDPTMAARLTRAKKKIVGSRIPYGSPGPPSFPIGCEPCLA